MDRMQYREKCNPCKKIVKSCDFFFPAVNACNLFFSAVSRVNYYKKLKN